MNKGRPTVPAKTIEKAKLTAFWAVVCLPTIWGGYYTVRMALVLFA